MFMKINKMYVRATVLAGTCLASTICLFAQTITVLPHTCPNFQNLDPQPVFITWMVEPSYPNAIDLLMTTQSATHQNGQQVIGSGHSGETVIYVAAGETVGLALYDNQPTPLYGNPSGQAIASNGLSCPQIPPGS